MAHWYPVLLPAAILLLPSPAPAQAAASALATSDSALVQHLRHTDPVFRQALGACTDVRVSWNRSGQTPRFTLRAHCEAKRPASERDDCAYDVEARGTLDDPEWATVRRMALITRCHG